MRHKGRGSGRYHSVHADVPQPRSMRPATELDAGETHQVFAEANAGSHLGNAPSQQTEEKEE